MIILILNIDWVIVTQLFIHIFCFYNIIMEVHKGPKITSSHSFNHIKNDDVSGISNTIPVNNDGSNKR